MSAQKGFAPVLILLAAAGLISFLLISSTAEFKNRLFSGLFPKPASQAATTDIDLRAYYPNPDMYTTHYLEGVKTGTAIRQVLWFEKQDQWSFKLYNSGPEDKNSRCHFDLLSWWDDGYLRYAKTHHECPGAIPNEVVYDPPILLMPRVWNESSGKWSYSGSSPTKYYENGSLVCTGKNAYTNEILGVEEVAPGERAIHWISRQNTTWDAFGKCNGWAPTHWQEESWFTDSLSKQGGSSAKAIVKSKGGNQAPGSQDIWDITFNRWQPLPLLPTPAPTSTPAPIPSPTPTATPQAGTVTFSNISVQRSTTSATITWTTNVPSTTKVIYGRSSSILDLATSVNTSLLTSHSSKLTNLRKNTTYYYKVTSKNSQGSEFFSSVGSFKTRD